MAKCERPRHGNEHQMAMTEEEKSPVEHPHKRDLPTWQAFISQLARDSCHKKLHDKNKRPTRPTWISFISEGHLQ